MNLQFCLEKLKNSELYENFIKENPNAYFCSGFFTIDLENIQNPDNQNHIDFYVPNSKKMFSFQLQNEIKLVPLEKFNEQIPNEITIEEIDFNEIKEIVELEKEKNNVEKKTQKILLSLQNIEGNNLIVGTIFISGLGLLKMKINPETKSVISFEKKSFFDFIRKG